MMDMNTNDMSIAELRKTDWQFAARRIVRALRDTAIEPGESITEIVVKITALAYYMWSWNPRGWRCRTPEEDQDDIIKLQHLVAEARLEEAVKKDLIECVRIYWRQIWLCAHSYPIHTNKAVALCFVHARDVHSVTPMPIVTLAEQVLDIQAGDSVADLGAGYGTFLCDASQYGVSFAEGYDINPSAYRISKIRNWLLQGKIYFTFENAFTERALGYKVDKVFSHMPAMVRDSMVPCAPVLQPYVKDVPSLTRMTWASILAAVEKMKQTGKAVVIVPTNVLAKTGKGEQRIRERLLQKGLVETVISLPTGIGIPARPALSMVVLSYGNRAVRMVNATRLRPNDIDTVAALTKNDGTYSQVITLEQMGAQEWVWIPERYIILPEDMVQNGKSIGELQVSIKRGRTLLAADLADLISAEKTAYGYLMLNDLADGQITKMTYLKEWKPMYERYAVQEGDLLLSRSMPFKMAVVPDLGKLVVMASGNMYAIRFKKGLMHPVYAMLYIMSAQGTRQLQRLSQGDTLQSISLGELQSFQIPMIPFAEQERIAEAYMKLQAKLNELKEAEEAVRDQIQKLLTDKA